MPSYRADPALIREVLRDPVHWLAFGAGTGLLPIAPGTWASAATALVVWWFVPVSQAWLLGLAALLLLLGIWLCGVSSRRLGVHDHQGIVLDEVVGMLATLAVTRPDPLWFVAAFFAFRLADVYKPWPIRDVDHRLPGGLGIMLDDVLAAVYAALAIMLLQWLFPGS